MSFLCTWFIAYACFQEEKQEMKPLTAKREPIPEKKEIAPVVQDRKVVQDRNVVQDRKVVQDRNVLQDRKVVQDRHVLQDRKSVQDKKVAPDRHILQDRKIVQDKQVVQDRKVEQDRHIVQERQVVQDIQVAPTIEKKHEVAEVKPIVAVNPRVKNSSICEDEGNFKASYNIFFKESVSNYLISCRL